MTRLVSRHDGGRLLWSSVVVVAVAAVALAVGWLATQHTRTTLYAPTTRISRVALKLASGSVDIVGSRGSDVSVQRVDRYAFGRSALERRSLAGGVLSVSSRCPRILLGSCSSSYRLTVPDDVSVSVQTAAGHVHFDGFRGPAVIQTGSGDVAVDAYCGFNLSATSGSGNVRVLSACAPEMLVLHTGSGSASAVVPTGQYRVSARSTSGRSQVSGVQAGNRESYSIEVVSRSGDVDVRGL